MSFRIIPGDCLEVLKTLPAESVHTCVTSPPYWGLRDYGVEGQIGLEKTPELFVSKMVEVFREVKRVLRDDGTLWLNLGDSYISQGGPQVAQTKWQVEGASDGQNGGLSRSPVEGLKAKDLCGIPWLVAFALRADGWYLRSDIIWHKPNPMPESVTDRPTKSHEYIFLLTKSPRYYYDAEAVKEANSPTSHPGTYRNPTKYDGTEMAQSFTVGKSVLNYSGRNKRSVWTVATAPYKGSHFATFPPKLIEPCILAGTSEQGCCSECGAPWERVVETTRPDSYKGKDVRWGNDGNGMRMPEKFNTETKTLGWQPSCTCNAETRPCVVLDPFAGAGTTGLVARRLGRSFIGIELNPQYLEMAQDRIVDDQPLFNTVETSNV
jgi:DNA modification methylase